VAFDVVLPMQSRNTVVIPLISVQYIAQCNTILIHVLS